MRPEEFGDGSTWGDQPEPAALSGAASGWQRTALVGVAATLQVIVMALTLVSGMLLWVAGWPYLVS